MHINGSESIDSSALLLSITRCNNLMLPIFPASSISILCLSGVRWSWTYIVNAPSRDGAVLIPKCYPIRIVSRTNQYSCFEIPLPKKHSAITKHNCPTPSLRPPRAIITPATIPISVRRMRARLPEARNEQSMALHASYSPVSLEPMHCLAFAKAG